jgi:GTPase SAR1 family protein
MERELSTSLCDIKYKIVFLGDSGVGKTSIIERFVKNHYEVNGRVLNN